LKTFFRWCVGRAVIDFSPVEGLSSSYRESSRDRVLTDQELAAIIVAARQMPPPYGGIVELLALTGQRRQEVSKLKWDELDEKSRTWSIPGSRTKNKKAHIVHLSEPAWQVIAQRPVGTYASEHLEQSIFRRIRHQSARLTRYLASPDGVCMISGGQ
jgi:integrase